MKMDHIGIAVANLEKARKFYQDCLGLSPCRVKLVERYRVKAEFFQMGDCLLELMEPLDKQGPVADFLEKNGPGVQHLAIEVPDVQAAAAELKAKGAWVIEPEAADDDLCGRVVFIHPVSTGGVVIELVQAENPHE